MNIMKKNRIQVWDHSLKSKNEWYLVVNLSIDLLKDKILHQSQTYAG